MNQIFDLAVIGGGPAGYVAAQRAGTAGLQTVIFEDRSLGGVCLNEGCIPTKALLHCAKTYTHARDGKPFGVSAENAVFDFAAFSARKTKVVKKLVAGVKASMKAAEVTVVDGSAVIDGRNEDGSFCITAAGQTWTARKILICTGSQASVPPVPGLKEAGELVMTSREALFLTEVPGSLTIIGGGVIGMEFAALFSALGCSVTVIEMLPKILGPLDGDVSALLQKLYTKRGVQFRLGCKVSSIEGGTVYFENAEGTQETATSNKILLSTGRKARLDGFGLEKLGVEKAVNAAGRPVGIKVDRHMQTSVPGVYAAGDVTGFSMLAHSASREAEVAVNHILGRDDSMSYDAIPAVVYTDPEVASVGLTAEEAAARDIPHICASLPMTYSGRFVAETERGEGLCKIVAEASSGKVLGVHMAGGPCSEIISAACLAVSSGMTLEQLRRSVFPHPSVSEILKETAFQQAAQ